MKVYRIEIKNKASHGPEYVGPFLASIYMKELERDTWRWKQSVSGHVICNEEPDSSLIEKGRMVCSCSNMLSFWNWIGGYVGWKHLSKSNFTLVQYTLNETIDKVVFNEINQVYFDLKDKSKYSKRILSIETVERCTRDMKVM